MYSALIAIIIIAAILLMLVVLAQNPKGGGLSSQFGGSGTTQLMGVRKTGDFLEKATWVLAISMLVLTLVANVMIPTTTDVISTPNLDNAGQQQQPTLPLDTSTGSESSDDALEGLIDDSSDSTSE
ncbi:MAG: preprotein translocase subunit SecG [Cytophagales bacterium]|nr:preprotein translocase subunit SecG [Cytophagales bacterium]